jgi:hypothetical protein
MSAPPLTCCCPTSINFYLKSNLGEKGSSG